MATKSIKSFSAQTELTLFRSRPTLTPDEAISFFSLQSGVSLGMDALWAHVLAGHLPISIEFDGQAFGRHGRIVACAEAQVIEDSSPPATPPEMWDDPSGTGGGRRRLFGTAASIPLEAATREFDSGSVLLLPEGFPERLEGAWDLCSVGEWQDITRRLRRGPPTFFMDLADTCAAANVFVARVGEPEVACEITDEYGEATRSFLSCSKPVFRLNALEEFVARFVEPKQESEYEGELRMTTLLCMLGALIESDGSRKKVLNDLLVTEIRGFSERSLDKYLSAASQAYTNTLELAAARPKAK